MDIERLEKIDKLKTKILKNIFYKKRTEKEILEKFKNEDSDILYETIENLKELGYINDIDYIKRYIHDVITLKNLSIFEIKYKLYSKGIKETDIEDYISENHEMLEDYELLAARNILNKKKKEKDIEEIAQYLRKKRYKADTISKIIEENKD